MITTQRSSIHSKDSTTAGFITRERYDYNEIVFTTGGDCIITYTPQINSPVVAMELTNEQLNKVQGMQGLEEYMKRAILIFAFDIKNHTNFFRQNAEQLAHDFPPQDGIWFTIFVFVFFFILLVFTLHIMVIVKEFFHIL